MLFFSWWRLLGDMGEENSRRDAQGVNIQIVTPDCLLDWACKAGRAEEGEEGRCLPLHDDGF